MMMFAQLLIGPTAVGARNGNIFYKMMAKCYHARTDPGHRPRWPTAMHQQKLILHRALMQAYAAELKAAGHHAYQIEVPDGSSLDSADLLDRALPAAIREIHLADPADEILMSGVSVGGPFEVKSTTD